MKSGQSWTGAEILKAILVCVCFAMMIFLIIVVIVSICSIDKQNEDMTIYSRFIPVENKPLKRGESYLVFDKDTDLVYVILLDSLRVAISPYYITDESNTQRIAIYPQDLDYLIKRE